MKNLNEQKKLTEKVIKEIDELKPFAYEKVANQTDPYTTECYPLYADVFVYNAIEDNKYYVKHIENDYIETVNKEELMDIIRDNIELISD